MTEDEFEYEKPVEDEAVSEAPEPETEEKAPVFEGMYPPMPPEYVKKKKSAPAWFVALITAVLTCTALIAAYTFLALPYVMDKSAEPKAVISYVQSSGASELKENIGEVSAVVEKCMPSLVSVSGTSEYMSFFGVSTQTVSGTGMIVSENGYILTSNALIGSKGETKVKIGDETYDAKLIGQDVSNDLAIIKIDKDGLKAVALGDSDSVKVGDGVIAIADVFGGNIGFSASKGIICGVNKSVSLENGTTVNFLQTDAAPNSLCSGGCLLDADGSVIGMLTSSISANSDKIAFAIPSNDIKPVMESIINTGEAPEEIIIGIRGTDTDHGVVVDAVIEDTPAKEAGVKKGDLVLKVDGKTVKSVEEINKIKDGHQKGDTIVLTVYRDGESIKIDIVL